MSRVANSSVRMKRMVVRYGATGDDSRKSDPYALADSRFKGKQMGISPPKKGRTDAVLLQKDYKPLFADDTYIDQEARERHEKYIASKSLPQVPFRPSSPPKKAEGKGSIYGTINPPPSYEPSGSSEVKKGAVKEQPRNFLTSPPKRGGFGFYHTTIGGSEFEYLSEPYGGVRKKYVGLHETQPISNQRFVSMCKGGGLFDTKIYSEENRAQTAPRYGMRARGQKPPGFVQSQPFRGMSSRGSSIWRFPEYISPTADEEQWKRVTRPDRRGGSSAGAGDDSDDEVHIQDWRSSRSRLYALSRSGASTRPSTSATSSSSFRSNYSGARQSAVHSRRNSSMSQSMILSSSAKSEKSSV
ncbi:putative protein of unknown function (DUF4586) [Monocercomonoides exilis]|uniref:putative protein of unknown function (DUF4586) n=1 Tax=Monocercomonoides exilis TaxID=2049356 RepID=UPI00355AA3EE|nr:putative protein of unknown function (DUF4586) [Monocercomonoides exilis]|eukprot:MONOS_2311.1-p1 / transcript=MONOS_2311.1 / gene=MONOS_2311 / organism=Monocercomonoides_exilis_PA203 / gene_product=unspecified product / transcript_product=unspecified product / location=Mono_scaffold00047:72648-74075(+) / protein_length=355 / sequence_SO=supercontig / SO=protein_coding / is_pseudo=false